MSTVKDFDFSGKKALIRVDFNVPLNSNNQRQTTHGYRPQPLQFNIFWLKEDHVS